MLFFFIGGCATDLYVIAFTSDLSSAGSDDSPYVEIVLNNGEVGHIRLYDREGDDYAENKGDLWRIPIRQFNFREGCVSTSGIRQVAIQEGGNDGWNIESIITMLDRDLLTVDFHVNRWIDGNGSQSEKEFVLRKA